MVKEKAIKKYITFSIDDGSKHDLKLLELLEKYELKATFYIPKHDIEHHQRSLTDKEVGIISQSQEVGAHSLNHVSLDTLSFEQQREEIFGAKRYLESLLNKEIPMFCYPYGIYNDKVSALVKEAGYIGARTGDCCFFEINDFFKMPVSLHIYPFPLLKKAKEFSYYSWLCALLDPLARGKKTIKKYNLKYDSFFSWFKLAKNMFDYVYKNGGVFHIWGHSWEIEKFNMWNSLEKFFKYLSKERNVIYLTNGEIVEELSLKL